MNGTEQSNDDSLQAPERLVNELKRACSPELFIPGTVDDAVLVAARKALQPGRERNRFGFRLVPWFAAATAIAVLGVFVLFKPASHPLSAARGDVNADGRSDILDAFVLAKELQAGKRVGLALDLNGDGVVDERDVLTLAAKVVKLEKGGG